MHRHAHTYTHSHKHIVSRILLSLPYTIYSVYTVCNIYIDIERERQREGLMIKSRRRWAVHVARMEEKMNACRIFVRKPEGKTEGLHVGGRVILKWILDK
jgi:hypothetical protein